MRKNNINNINSITYKGVKYFVTGIASSLNGGVYFVCYSENDEAREDALLIPTDSSEVHVID